MKISHNGLDAIKRAEGWRPSVYADQAGLPTIGYGHLISRNELGIKTPAKETPATLAEWMAIAKLRYPTKITVEEGLALLQKEVVHFELAVQKLVTRPLLQCEFDALVSFAYNLGAGALASSTLLKRINAGAEKGIIQKEFAKWNKVRDPKTRALVVSAGLTLRRKREASLWGGEAVIV